MSGSPTLLERVWEYREDVLYPKLFGGTGDGIYTLSAELFSSTFGKSCDPRWLSIGAFECAPTDERRSWVYLSSGLTNPWGDETPPDDPAMASWLGAEYFFNTVEQADWGVQLVNYVTAYDLLLSHGTFPGRKALSIGDRVPVQIRDKTDRLSLLRKLMVVVPEFVPSSHQLESGQLHLLQLVGITEAEAQFAREEGSDALCERLREAGALDVTDPWRESVV